MKAIIIPTILAATVLVSGMFAFMPIERAGTVHTTIQANTIKFSVATASKSAAAQDFTISCPSASDGCQILEVAADNNDGANTLVIDNIQATIDGETYTIRTDDVTIVANARQLLPDVGGTAIRGGDSVTIDVAAGSTSTSYRIFVVALVEGGQSISVT